jgi:hypothetical protein
MTGHQKDRNTLHARLDEACERQDTQQLGLSSILRHRVLPQAFYRPTCSSGGVELQEKEDVIAAKES